jgi:hypothetical protein
MRVGYYSYPTTKSKNFILSCHPLEYERMVENEIATGALKITFNRGLLTIRPAEHGGPSLRQKGNFYQVIQSSHDARTNPSRLEPFAFTEVPVSAFTMDHGCLIIDLNAFAKAPVRSYKTSAKPEEPAVATTIHSLADLKSVPAPVTPPPDQPTPEVTPEPMTVQVKVPPAAGIDEERLSELLWELNGMIDRHEDLDLFINDDNHLVAEITIRKRIGG